MFAGKCLSGPGQVQDGFQVKFVVVPRLDLNGSTITIKEDIVQVLFKAGDLPEESSKMIFITALHTSSIHSKIYQMAAVDGAGNARIDESNERDAERTLREARGPRRSRTMITPAVGNG